MAEKKIVNIPEDDFQILKPFFTQYNSRDLNTINTIVLHWTAGSKLSNDIKTLNSNKLGYHFLIEKNGKITQGAKLNKRIGHSGFSYGPNGRDVNTYSIGISFSMLGILPDGSEDKFTDEMYNSLKNLILDLKLSLPNLKYITGHHWISPGRKIDPYTFDFSKIVRDSEIKKIGIEIWKTGYAPFPDGLSDCECIKFGDLNSGNKWCKKSKGECRGQGDERYSERALSTKVSDQSFLPDTSSE